MKKILLVEDNEMNKDMLSRRLIKKGYEVVFAMDGQEAIDMAQSETPDVILMDMGLPVKDGLQATKEIKENGRMDLQWTCFNGRAKPEGLVVHVGGNTVLVVNRHVKGDRLEELTLLG